MGKASVKADYPEIAKLIEKWGTQNHFTFDLKIQDAIDEPATHIQQIKGQSSFYKFICQCWPSDEEATVDLKIGPRGYVNISIHAALFLGLFYAAHLITNLLVKFNLPEVLLFILCAIWVITSIWWKDNWLTIKLTKMEGAFWDMVSQTHDSQQLTLTKGQLYAKKNKLFTEIALAGMVIYFCSKFLSLLGFAISFLLCAPIFIMITTELIHYDNPQWHWRFWLMRNVFQWTWLMLSTFAIVPVLLAIECFMPLEIYNSPNDFNIIKAIERGHFRDITPATADALEKNAYEHITQLVRFGIANSDKTPAAKKDNYQFNLYAAGVMLFGIFTIAIAFFTYRPFRAILVIHKTWQQEVSKQRSQPTPSVPYLPQAWKWQTPRSLYALILLHYLLGGIINIAAVIFCIDGLSYLLAGRAFIVAQIGNLWSWIFVCCKILFGPANGQIVGAFFVIVICLPVLTLLATFGRRFLKNIWLTIRALHAGANQTESIRVIQNDLKQACEEFDLTDPVIILTRSKGVNVSLHWLVLIRKSVIEVSRDTVNLLSPQELKAAIAHELGHMRQGPWRVSILKLLSSLALFPNYYLTLCMNWAKKEIEADRFAIDVTKDAQSLKQALIKTSAAQISYYTSTTPKPARRFHRLISALKRRLHLTLASVRFFFGDGLFGYAHPYLSERLEMIHTKGIEDADR